MTKLIIVNAYAMHIKNLFILCVLFHAPCFATIQRIEVQPPIRQAPPAQQLAVVPAPAPHIAPQNRSQRCKEWFKLNWKPMALITSVITVGVVCGVLAWNPDPQPLIFPESNCIPFPLKAMNQECYSITVHNCGECAGNIPSQIRCAENGTSNPFPSMKETLERMCLQDSFDVCFEQAPCSTPAQTQCIPDSFAQQMRYLNQTCTAGKKPKLKRLKTLKRRKS